MLPFKEYGAGEISLVLMPFLGGSQREWIQTVGLLSKEYRCFTVDLPGFGAAAAVPGYSVSEMADAVINLLSSLDLSRYVLVGHSMAGKVSAVVTRRLISDGLPLVPPTSLILVAPSPPGAEPMSDSKRSDMLSSLGTESQIHRGGYLESDRPSAEQFVRDNLADTISDLSFGRTVDDVLAMNPAAWTAWLESGSKEDCGAFVGVMDLPTLVVAGREDQALGPEAQRLHTMPHFRQVQLAEEDCSHLIPLEKPEELASLILNFLEQIKSRSPLVNSMDKEYLRLINSGRVSPQTRNVLLARLDPDDSNYGPSALTKDELLTLRHVLARVIPQREPEIDLAARLNQRLGEEKGDGWRYATLPSDIEAYRAGLSLLEEFATKLSAVPFGRLSSESKDSLLDAITLGRLHSPKLDLKRWFEDLRADATQLYVSQPQTLARMGYSGIADDPSGFLQIGMGKREEWEPESR